MCLKKTSFHLLLISFVFYTHNSLEKWTENSGVLLNWLITTHNSLIKITKDKFFCSVMCPIVSEKVAVVVYWCKWPICILIFFKFFFCYFFLEQRVCVFGKKLTTDISFIGREKQIWALLTKYGKDWVSRLSFTFLPSLFYSLLLLCCLLLFFLFVLLQLLIICHFSSQNESETKLITNKTADQSTMAHHNKRPS